MRIIGKVQGSSHTPVVECINPIKDKWRVRWNYATSEDNTTYMECEFSHRPTLDEIHKTIVEWYNDQIDQRILSGFRYEGVEVWLSTENQFNYKSAADLAIQTNGATLPITFKLGTENNPVYRTFEELPQLMDFYTKAMQYIQQTLNEGWREKDNVNWNTYKTLLEHE